MKKILLSLISLVFITFSLCAMPGFSSYIPDQPGEYVYYRDYSFGRESYIGIVCYDSQSYQLRYYAPETKQKLPDKTVATLVTVDLVKNHFDFTGEKILVADYNNNDDFDIINYLHDLMYEFANRRSKHFEINPSNKGYVNFDTLKTNGLYESTYFEQFGGNVRILYDCIIPFFNIKRIENEKGVPVFECVQLGKINSSDDPIFDTFHVFPEKIKVKQNSQKVKKTKPVDFSSGRQHLTLDSTWEKKLDYIWVQNEDAIITLMSYAFKGHDKDPYYVQYYLLRNFLECKDNTFIDYITTDVIFFDKGFKLYSDTHSPSIKKVYTTIKYITASKNPEEYDYMSFAATRGAYQIKRTYYDSILRTYSID